MLQNQVAIKIHQVGNAQLIICNCSQLCCILSKTHKVLIQSREAYSLYYAVRGISWLTIC